MLFRIWLNTFISEIKTKWFKNELSWSTWNLSWKIETVIDPKTRIKGCKFLKSMGFSDFHIRFWQIIRMGTILCISVVLGAIASLPLNSIALRPIFGLMGATHMEIEVNPFEVYFKYPLLLLLVICLSTAVTTASIKRINLMEINNED